MTELNSNHQNYVIRKKTMAIDILCVRINISNKDLYQMVWFSPLLQQDELPINHPTVKITRKLISIPTNYTWPTSLKKNLTPWNRFSWKRFRRKQKLRGRVWIPWKRGSYAKQIATQKLIPWKVKYSQTPLKTENYGILAFPWKQLQLNAPFIVLATSYEPLMQETS